jgi:hypothetical protein
MLAGPTESRTCHHAPPSINQPLCPSALHLFRSTTPPERPPPPPSPPPPPPHRYGVGIGLAGSLMAISFYQAVIHHLLYFRTMRWGWHMRISFTGNFP